MSRRNEFAKAAYKATVITIIATLAYYYLPVIWYKIVTMFAYAGEVG